MVKYNFTVHATYDKPFILTPYLSLTWDSFHDICHRYDIARALLARRDLEVDVLDFRDCTPLVMAVQYGYSHLVRLMLIAGADPSTGEQITKEDVLNIA